MKIKTLCLLFLIFCMNATPLFGLSKYGALQVFTEIKGSEIYVDGKLAGKDSVIIEKIEVGSHYVKVEAAGNVYYSKLIEIKAGEVNTIFVEPQEGTREEEEGANISGKQEKAIEIMPGRSSPSPTTPPLPGLSYFNIYASYAFLSLSEYYYGTSYNFNLDPVFGVGIDYNSLPKDSSSGFNVGLNYNFSSKYTYSGLTGSGNLGLSAVYANVIFNAQKSESSRANFGFGVNYSSWSISNINGSLGYQGFFELLIPTQSNFFGVKIGYEIFNATEMTGSSDSKGFFVRGGYAYGI